MKRLFLCLLMLCAVPATALAQAIRLDKLKVEVKRIEVDGQRMYEVDASASVQAPPASVWKTLTTYERMNEFVPDLSSCRVLSRNGNEVIIEQQGMARFLFMNHPIHLVVRATETPLTSIDIALISGDTHRLFQPADAGLLCARHAGHDHDTRRYRAHDGRCAGAYRQPARR